MGIRQNTIAIICNYELLPERVGGMDYFFWKFDEKCKENNIQVDWFFPNKATHGGYSNLNIISSEHQEVELFFVNYIKYSQNNYSKIITHFIELCTSVFKSIKQNSNADIIAVDHNPRPLNGYSTKKIIKKKIKGFLYSKYIDVFVGVSDYSKKEIIKEFGLQLTNRSIVISNGLQFDKFQKKTDYNFQRKFIIASHLREDKGVQDVIKAVAEMVKDSSYDFSIAIYGKGYYENHLKELAKKLDVEQFFNFMGSVANLNEIYCKYDYLIHPSHGETFCYSVLEALICRLPVITTKNQGNVLGLVIENYNGFLFEENNERQLKNILTEIISNQNQLNAAKNMNPEIDTFSLEKMVENYYKLLS